MDGADVLGIDPGIGATGYGLIRLVPNNVEGCVGAYRGLSRAESRDAPFLIDCGVLKTSPKKKTPERLRKIYDLVLGLIQKHSPRILAVEKAFYGKSVSVALTIGQARGAAMLAAANLGLPVYEFSAREVKQAVTGNGAADKSQVQYMIGQLLNLKNPPDSPDACDALAVALTYHFRSKSFVGVNLQVHPGESKDSPLQKNLSAEATGRPRGRTTKPALVGKRK